MSKQNNGKNATAGFGKKAAKTQNIDTGNRDDPKKMTDLMKKVDEKIKSK